MSEFAERMLAAETLAEAVTPKPSPPPQDVALTPAALLDALAEAEGDDAQREAFNRLIAILAESDAYTQAIYEDRLKSEHGFNKSRTRQAIKDATPAADSRNGPDTVTQTQWRDAWLEVAGSVAHGGDYEDWRRYRDGYWPEVATAIIKDEICDVGEQLDAQAEWHCNVTARGVSAIETLAAMRRYHDPREWDRSDVLVLRNGALDLGTLTLRNHDPGDRATRRLGYDYDPQARCNHFTYALQSTIPEAADFIQEFAGYCLTPRTDLETAVWFYGPKGSGKSTVMSGFEAMLGDFVLTLGLARIERSNFALGSLPGKRLLISTEQPGLYMQADWLLNAIISGERVTVENKFKDAYDVYPTAKVLWAMNTLPRVNSESGLFRRVKVVEFEHLPCDPDPDLKRLIAQERPGVLNWAIEGLRRLRQRGRFTIPDCVRVASEDFEENNDKERIFLEGYTFTTIGAAELYTSYKSWCESYGHKAKSMTAVASDWRRLGLTKRRTNSGVVYERSEEVSRA